MTFIAPNGERWNYFRVSRHARPHMIVAKASDNMRAVPPSEGFRGFTETCGGDAA